MNVVGEDVVGFDQGRRAALQSLDRQAVSGVDARRPQDGNDHPVARTPIA